MSYKIGVIIFPGSNCDHDMIHCLELLSGQTVHELWHKEPITDDWGAGDIIVLPGGFSYGDYLRPGSIARFSTAMESLQRLAGAGATILGICNGFQILCEAGLLPGALLRNANQLFICRNSYIKTVNNATGLTKRLRSEQVVKIPIAHADGRYYCDSDTLKKLSENKQILFRYCDAEGNVSEKTNPNGSLSNIAGICNEKGNVFGMMPHPERACEDVLGNTDGRLLLEALLKTSPELVG